MAYAIAAENTGNGNVTVTTAATGDDVFTSGGSGIIAYNAATSLASGTEVSVTAYGTINSGGADNGDNTAPAGILAGYRGSAPSSINPTPPAPNLNVTGTVVVTNYANITAAADSSGIGYGINAYNWGNGDVTINEEAGRCRAPIRHHRAGARRQEQWPCLWKRLSHARTERDGRGPYARHGHDRQWRRSAQYGCGQHQRHDGDWRCRESRKQRRRRPQRGTGYRIQPAKHGFGDRLRHDLFRNAERDLDIRGIDAGYNPGTQKTANGNVSGNVSVDSYATINAASGYGIEGYNWGTGNVTIIAEASSSITATGISGVGIGAFANDGGSVSVTQDLGAVDTGLIGLSAQAFGAGTITITNGGRIIGTAGDGIFVNQSATGATGSTTITNTGNVTGVTSATTAVIVVHGNTTGLATINNFGTIGTGLISGTLEVAIYEDGGKISIDNTGTIDGALNVADGTFTNETGGVWNAGGASGFGVTSGTGFTIDNAGIINLSHSASLGSTDGLTIDNTGTINSVDTDTISGAGITNSGVIDVNGGSLTLTSTTVTNDVADPSTEAVINGTVSVAGGAVLDLWDSSIAGGNVSNSGAIHSAGNDLINATITNVGTIEVTNGQLTLFGSISGSGGSLQIDSGAKLELNLADGQDVAFNGGGGELIVDRTASVSGNIHGLMTTDEIDLQGINYATATATYNSATGVLSVTDASGDQINLNIGSGYGGAHFAGSNDGQNGTLITLNANDDAPAVAAGDKAETATVTEALLITGSPLSNLNPPASGTIHFTDVDLTDRPTATISGQSVTWTDAHNNSMSLNSTQVTELEQAFHISQSGNNNGAVGWTYSITDSDLDFLGAGQTLTVTSNVKLDDHEGGSDTAQVTVTVHGSDDAPSIVGESNPATQTVILSEFADRAGCGRHHQRARPEHRVVRLR